MLLLFLSVAAVAKGRARDHVPVALDVAAFGAAYAVTGVLHRESWLVLGILAVMWLGLISIHRDRAMLVLVSIGLAIVGPAYESIVTATHAFGYDVRPLVLRVPIWLPALYLIGGVLASSVAHALTSIDR